MFLPITSKTHFPADLSAKKSNNLLQTPQRGILLLFLGIEEMNDSNSPLRPIISLHFPPPLFRVVSSFLPSFETEVGYFRPASHQEFPSLPFSWQRGKKSIGGTTVKTVLYSIKHFGFFFRHFFSLQAFFSFTLPLFPHPKKKSPQNGEEREEIPARSQSPFLFLFFRGKGGARRRDTA